MSGKYPGGFVTAGAPAGYSVAFNGSSYLTATNNAAYAFGTGDFCVEAWVYLTATPSGQMIVGSTYQSTSSGFSFSIESNVLKIRMLGDPVVLSGATTVTPNAWHHIAVTRSGTSLKVFLDGAQDGTATNSDNVVLNSTAFNIARLPNNSGFLSGYISNLRVLKGTALYTATFTPPTQLFPIANTQLLTCQSPTIIDNSINAFSITAVGSAAPSTFTPFVGYTAGASGFQPALGAAAPGVWTLDEATYYQQNRLWPIYDPYFNQTTLMLHGVGSNTANNSVFVDSSSNNFAITRNGNTTQGTYTPFSQTGWSGYIISPLSNYLYSPSNVPAFTGDFTIECWVRLNSLGSTAIISASSSTSWDLYLNAAGTIVWYTGAAIRITTSLTVPLNAWTHVALVRSSGVAKIYVNGIADVGTYSSSATIGTGSEFLYIGRDGGASAGFDGYVSNYRLAVGAAVYTSNFTPPTAPLGATTGGQNPPTGTQTYLLTCQSNRFVDNSGNSNTPIIVGTPSVQTYSPFPPTTAYTPRLVGGSGYFDFTGDFLTLAYNAALAPTSGNFTVECWVYFTAVGGADQFFVGNVNGSTGNGDWGLFWRGSSSRWEFVASSSGLVAGLQRAFNTTAPTIGQWYYVVGVKNGSTLSCYVNGVNGTNATLATVSNSTTGYSIGSGASGTNPLSGYLSGLRFLNGTALYTANFTPPTAPPTAITNTQLLCNFTNAGIIDSAADNVLETLGNASISTVQSKYSGSSMAFNGTNSYLKIPSNVQLAFGTGNFTIEFWAYFNVVNAGQTIIDFRPDGTNNSLSPYLELSSGGAIIYYLSGNTQITTSALSANAWYHIALVRSDGINNKIYVNGVQSGSTFSNSSSLLQSGVVIGFNRNNGGVAYQYLNGYIDDLRITNGIARYISNFTPPTSQLQSQ